MGEGDAIVKTEAQKIINNFQELPRLVVFDLDHTLWPLYSEGCDEDEMPCLYPEAKGIIHALKEKGIDMAIASRSPASKTVLSFLTKLGLDSMFVAKEIYPTWTHKTEHIKRIHKRTGIPFHSILFFDDEARNTESVSNMGVTSIFVGDGLNLEAFRQGLSIFSQKYGSFAINGGC